MTSLSVKEENITSFTQAIWNNVYFPIRVEIIKCIKAFILPF